MSLKWSASDVGRPWGHAPHWAGRERSVHVGGCCSIFFFFWDFDKPFSGGERRFRTESWSPVLGGREQKRMFPHGSIRWPPWLLSLASLPASFPCSPVWHPDPQASRARPCWPCLAPFCISSLCLHLNGRSLIHKAGSVCRNHNPLHSTDRVCFITVLCLKLLTAGDVVTEAGGRLPDEVSWAFPDLQVFQSWEHISACWSLIEWLVFSHTYQVLSYFFSWNFNEIRNFQGMKIYITCWFHAVIYDGRAL